ncbi:dnaJ homolog subfamily B member 6-like isoform X2 [Watersipora subatra]|uniref:dnaJ homolog subfamily B member 6-like isoform X2 n=1 Tax=Watersipora subatra TaxID=2589382 RepID=UPI00355B15E0
MTARTTECSDDYYDMLGITRSATSSEIKKGYRTQALKWHPDKNPDNKEEAEKRFKLIAEAYEVLSDKEKKRIYDKYGKEGLNPSNGHSSSSSRANHFDGFPGFTGFHFQDPFDLFSQFFGGSDPFESAFTHRSRGQRTNQHIHQTVGDFGFPGFGFPNGFGSGGFNGGSILANQDDFFGNGFGSSFFSSSSFGGGGGGGNMTMSSTSTSFINGKQVTNSRVIKDGNEITTVTENGHVVSRKVNGVEEIQRVENVNQPSLEGRTSSGKRRRN